MAVTRSGSGTAGGGSDETAAGTRSGTAGGTGTGGTAPAAAAGGAGASAYAPGTQLHTGHGYIMSGTEAPLTPAALKAKIKLKDKFSPPDLGRNRAQKSPISFGK
jgi:hypothetical protein